jgi:phosphohistidine phosphatase SixA
VIYLRHGPTDWSQNERELEWVKELLADPGNEDLFEDCDRQRLLTDEGRDVVRGIGGAIRELGVPIGRVLASPWCRVRETADLGFGGHDVAKDQLFDSGYLDRDSGERRRFRDALRGLLSEDPGPGSNTAIVGHMPQLQDAAGISLQEGEAAVFDPGGGDFKLLKRLGPEDWHELDD